MEGKGNSSRVYKSSQKRLKIVMDFTEPSINLRLKKERGRTEVQTENECKEKEVPSFENSENEILEKIYDRFQNKEIFIENQAEGTNLENNQGSS